ncbi:MAG: HAMP domain-containing sensor histidine kinase [Crocinitomicaceae bacterium]
MKKVRVHFILILVVTAMMALLLIQSVQTAFLVDRKSTEFNDQFKTQLERITLKHEKAEDIRQYMSLADNDFSVQYQDILKEEFQNLLSAQESISIQDTSIFENGKIENYLIIKGKTYDSISGVTAEQRVIGRDVRKFRDLFDRNNATISHDSLKYAIQLDRRVIQQIFKKARFVNEMMIEAFRNNIYEGPEDRVDLFFLDSLLSNELALDNLPKGYRFMITDEYRAPVHFEKSSKNYTANIDTTYCYKTLLYPSNPIDHDLYLHINFPKQKAFLFGKLWGPLAINLSLVLLIIMALVFMFRTILAQRKLSEMKNDFISNMTHEFKTPISTISLACEAMNDSDMVGNNTSTAKPYVNMISDENQRLGLLVERILQSATLERGEVQLRKERVLINEVILDIVQNANFRITKENGLIELNLTPDLIYVQADKMHLTNTISNLIDNAIKYSDGAAKIIVELQKEGKKNMLSVIDNGIGIKKEHLNKIFDKLYRIPTGNIHNVKGFGLGLSYVKAISELHAWDIQVKSKLGQGSQFILIIQD